MKKKIFKITAISLLVTINSYMAYSIYEIKSNLKTNNKLNEDKQLVEMVYYQDLNLDDQKYQLINDDNYLIYFRSNNCKFCLETDQLVMAYINKGYYQKVPIYFAEYENTPNLYNNIYNIDSNPTMILINNNQIVEQQEGIDSIFDLLDSIVHSPQ